MAVAIDSVVFGFDGEEIRLLLIHRGFKPEKNKWSLMGGFVQENESLDDAAARILENLTGLEGMFMEQVQVFGDPRRDPVERTISVVYFSLIDIEKYKKQLSEDYHPEWFSLDQLPDLIFDHGKMVQAALGTFAIQSSIASHPFLNCCRRSSPSENYSICTRQYTARSWTSGILSGNSMIRVC